MKSKKHTKTICLNINKGLFFWDDIFKLPKSSIIYIKEGKLIVRKLKEKD